jgi:hypothetical protein
MGRKEILTCSDLYSPQWATLEDESDGYGYPQQSGLCLPLPASPSHPSHPIPSYLNAILQCPNTLSMVRNAISTTATFASAADSLRTSLRHHSTKAQLRTKTPSFPSLDVWTLLGLSYDLSALYGSGGSVLESRFHTCERLKRYRSSRRRTQVR